MRTLVALLLLTTSLLASPRGTVKIRDFSPGLYTSVDPERVPAGGATKAHDLDFTLSPGDVTTRKGADWVCTMWGADSILWNGLATYRTRSKDNHLLVAIDSATVGYGRVYIGEANRANFDAIDTFLVKPYIDSCDYLLGMGYCLKVGVFISGVESAAVVSDTLSAEELVDSLVTKINAGAASSLVTAIDLDDSLLVVEDAANVDVSIEVCNKAGLYNCVSFVDLKVTTIIDSALSGVVSADALATIIPATGRLTWAKFDDVVYFSSGVSKGRAYNGYKTSIFPTKPPGEPSVIPLTTPGTLKGLYRYAIQYSTVDSTSGAFVWSPQLGYLSTPVVADSQQVMLWDFPPPTIFVTGQADACWARLWRSAGTIGELDPRDSVWLIDSVAIDSANYSTVSFVDTTSDVTMRTHTGLPYASSMSDSLRYREYADGGTASVFVPSGCGAPVIYSAGTVADSGIWGGIGIDWNSVAGWAWVCTFVDTVNGIPSDTGRSVYMYNDQPPSAMDDSTLTSFQRATTEVVNIVLPRTNQQNTVCNLYRGALLAVTADSARFYESEGVWTGVGAQDFMTVGYFYLGSYTPGDTIQDSLGYDDLIDNATYERNAVQEIITDMAVVGNRLVTTDGYGVIVSNEKDSLTTFSLFDETFIDPDDGEEVEAIFLQRNGTIKVMKKSRSFTLSEYNGRWVDRQLSSNYGCVAGGSVCSTPLGDYFLSTDGIREEAEGRYYEGAYDRNFLSAGLNNFENIPRASLAGAYGVYYENKYILTIPNWDTAYVMCDTRMPGGEIRRGFTTWKMRMAASTLFSTSSEPDSLYFCEPGSDEILLYGNRYRDAHETIEGYWTSGALFEYDNYNYEVDKFLTHLTREDPTYEDASIWFVDHTDSAFGTVNITGDGTASHLSYEQAGLSPSYRWQVAFSLTHYPFFGGLAGPMVMRAIDVYLIKRNEVVGE